MSNLPARVNVEALHLLTQDAVVRDLLKEAHLLAAAVAAAAGMAAAEGAGGSTAAVEASVEAAAGVGAVVAVVRELVVSDAGCSCSRGFGTSHAFARTVG